jgi:hypothetical protein
MKRSHEVAGAIEVGIERFGSHYGFIEESIAQTVGLPLYQLC